jgi:hypothetical protein
MQVATSASRGASRVVGGCIETGIMSVTGEGSTIKGYLYSGTTSNTGANSIVMGNLTGVTGTGLGAGSTDGGNIRAGGLITCGVGDIVTSTVEENPLVTLGHSVSEVIIQTTKIAAGQKALKYMGTGTTLTLITFGTNDETLTEVIYCTLDYSTIAGGKTLTVDGRCVDSNFLFNISNYLTFAA